MNSRLWLVLAQILCFCTFAIYYIARMGIHTKGQRIAGLAAFLLCIVLFVRYRLYKNGMALLITAFLLWSVVTSLLEHAGPVMAFGNTMVRSWYICLLFMLVTYVAEEKTRDRFLVFFFVLFSIFTAAIFILSFVNVTMIELKPGFSGIPHLGTFISGRLSLFGGPNSAGPMAQLLILISAILICRFRKAKFHVPLVILFSLTLLAGVVAISLTRCRTGMIATAAGLGLFAFIIVREKFIEKRAKAMALGIVAFFVVMVLSFCIMLIPKRAYDAVVFSFAEQSEEIDAEEVGSELEVYELTYSIGNLTDRTLIWTALIRMLNEKPVLWITGETAAYKTGMVIGVYPERPDIPIFSAHNGLLEMLATFGIPGLMFTAAMLIVWIVSAIRLVFSDSHSIGTKAVTTVCLAVFINSLTESYLFPNTLLYLSAVVFFMIMGYIRSEMKDKEQKEKKNIFRFIAVPVALAAVAGLTFFAYTNAKKLNRLPESKVAVQDPHDFVRLGDAVTEDMMTPEFWVKNRSDAGADVMAPRLSMSQILGFNHENRRMLSALDNRFALEELGDRFYVRAAKAFVEDTSFTPLAGTAYLLDGKQVNEEYWTKLTENANIEALTERIDLNFGYSVVRTVLKRFPTDDRVFAEGSDLYNDELAQVELTPFMPVAVLHESADKEWYYVLTKSNGGWVRKTGIAICSSREEWLRHMDPDDFIVVIGRELRLPADPYNAVLSELSVPMGTVLPIVPLSEAPESINERVGYGNYICRLVTRNEEGFAEDAYVLIPAGDDVHQGYLEYTEENAARLLFRHLGAEYGWAGDNNSVDCSAYVRQVYACFGLDTPRSSSEQAKMTCSKTCHVENSTVSKKLQILEDAPIGTILHFNGHIMMYLGMVDGVPYCISSTGSIAKKTDGSMQVVNVNTVIITSMSDTYRLDGRTWLEHLDTIVIP